MPLNLSSCLSLIEHLGLPVLWHLAKVTAHLLDLGWSLDCLSILYLKFRLLGAFSVTYTLHHDEVLLLLYVLQSLSCLSLPGLKITSLATRAVVLTDLVFDLLLELEQLLGVEEGEHFPHFH